MKKIIVFALFVFLLGEIVRLDFGGGLVLKPLDIGVGIAALFWMIPKIVRKKRIIPNRIFVSGLLFAGSGALSLLINYSTLTLNQFFVSAMYLVRWIAYAVIFFVVWDFDKSFKEKIKRLLIFVGSIVVFLGYLQYFFYPSLRNLYYLGWDEHMFRMFSVFLDPNFAGAFFVLFFLFAVNMFIKNKNILIGIISALTLGAVFLTFSRSALIMLIISSGVLLTLMNKKKLIIWLLVIVLSVLMLSSKYFNIENINLFRIASSEARLEAARDAISIIKNNPIFGVGFNAYRYAQVRYGFRNEESQIVSHADSGTENSFLFVIATTGLVGFVLLIFLWFRILKNDLADRPLVIASTAGVFIDSFFVNSLFYPFIMFWLWIILALSIKYSKSRAIGSK